MNRFYHSILHSLLRICEPKRMHNNDLVGSARKDTMDVEGADRLSSLPDDIIHKILSFVSVKDAIGTSVLSSRWRSVWTSMPYLNIENLIHPPHLSIFISNVLSHRNNQTQVSSINLVLDKTVKDDESVERIFNYTLSHNVQQLSVTRPLPGKMVEYPYSFIATPTCDLIALTTLHLHHVELSDDKDSTGKCIGFFSKCPNLKNLLIKRCRLRGTKVLTICHPRLSNLTLENTPLDMKTEEVVNVVAPQPKNLTIKWCEGKHLISAPGITSFAIDVSQRWQLCTPAGFHSLEKVDLYMYNPYKEDAHQILCLLQQLRSVQLLKLNLSILEFLFSQMKPLSSSMELTPHKACVFANAKILKFIKETPVMVYLEVQAQEKVTTSTKVKNYETFPRAIFPTISHEEIKAMSDVAKGQVFVERLGLLLKQCKANTNSEKAHVYGHGKPEYEIFWAWDLQRNLGKLMAQFRQRKIVAVENCFMMAWIRQRYNQRLKTHIHPIIAWLQEMRSLFGHTERLITEQLPASKRDVMLPIFLSLCEDGTILTDNMLGWMTTIK